MKPDHTKDFVDITNKSKDQITELADKQFHKAQRRAYKKMKKPVRWNGQIFESITALGKHLRMASPSSVSNYIKLKRKLKGHYVERIK